MPVMITATDVAVSKQPERSMKIVAGSYTATRTRFEVAALNAESSSREAVNLVETSRRPNTMGSSSTV